MSACLYLFRPSHNSAFQVIGLQAPAIEKHVIFFLLRDCSRETCFIVSSQNCSQETCFIHSSQRLQSGNMLNSFLSEIVVRKHVFFLPRGCDLETCYNVIFFLLRDCSSLQRLRLRNMLYSHNLAKSFCFYRSPGFSSKSNVSFHGR